MDGPPAPENVLRWMEGYTGLRSLASEGRDGGHGFVEVRPRPEGRQGRSKVTAARVWFRHGSLSLAVFPGGAGERLEVKIPLGDPALFKKLAKVLPRREGPLPPDVARLLEARGEARGGS